MVIPTDEDLIERGLRNKRESKHIEFKESFDINSKGEWCEIIKDIVAIANSGGGIIIFGLNNKGEPTHFDVSDILSLDPAIITDRIERYTGIHSVDFEILERHKNSNAIAVLLIQSAEFPIIFEKPGTYPKDGGKQESAFSKGTVYFRHGAKSEPGNTDDIRKHIEQKIEEVRQNWMEGVRKVIEAPPDHQVTILPKELIGSESSGTFPIRITDDPKAPGFYRTNTDNSYPYRQTELIAELNKRLNNEVKVNPYDIQSVRQIYGIDTDNRFSHQPKYSTRQYSNSFVDWILEKYNENQEFFQAARAGHATKRKE